uniref:Uncharacterized protein n=1 Tax=Geospiza parvula TaxID=87175 RepID=A0A8C3MB06_GEOPR
IFTWMQQQRETKPPSLTYGTKVWFLSRKITNLVLLKCVFSQASSRGIKNVYSVEQKKKKQEEIERRMAASRPGEEGGLRVSLKKKQCDSTIHMFTVKICIVM